MEIPDQLRCLFSGAITVQDDKFIIEVPDDELTHGTISEGHMYRVAILQSMSRSDEPSGESNQNTSTASANRTTDSNFEEFPPPVEQGDIRDLRIKDTGEKGDGVAYVERGYVIIVPGADPGDEVTVEITAVQDTVGFGRIVPDS